MSKERDLLAALVEQLERGTAKGYYIEPMQKASAFLAQPSPEGLDVERLARALQATPHSTEVRDQWGVPLAFGDLKEPWATMARRQAKAISAAYAGEGEG